MTDQLQLPKNTRKGLLRMGLKPVSLGNQMLFASQCITLVHAQMDAGSASA
jgi:tRNA (pseudouridine54-N1)-methyltransferase